MNVIKSWLSKTQTNILLIIIVYCVVVSISNPAFLTLENIFNIFGTSSWTMILALGALLVLISGGIDVSCTCVAIFGAYTSARILQTTGIENLALAFVIAILVGIALGAINALVIHCFKLPPFIATLGTQSIFLGLMATLVGTLSINTTQFPRCMKNFGAATLFTITSSDGTHYGLSVFIVPVVIFIIATWFIIYRTMLGRGIVALGNSEESAIRAGYNLFKIRMFIYIYVGILAAIAGVILISQVAWITPISNQIIGSELTIIAAVIIGGTKLSGGKGTIFGTILGVLLIRLFATTLIFIGLSTSWNDFFTGLVLLVILTWTSSRGSVRRRRMLLFEE